MDFHAHLDKHEVIGLLAGSWHPDQRVLRVERALPVREALAGRSDGTNVEMDTDDQFKVRFDRLCGVGGVETLRCSASQ